MGSDEISVVVPSEVVLRQGPLQADPADLPAEEERLVAQAVPGRRNAFAAGRAYARDALGEIGHRHTIIPAHKSRAPVWPAGVVGSIAHTKSWAVAAVAPAHHIMAIGVDVETVDRVGDDLTERLTTDAERQYLTHPGMLGIVFSLKEAIYKAQHPLLGLPLGFRDVTLDLSVAERTGQVQVHELSLDLAWHVTDGRVLAVAHAQTGR